MKLRHRLLVVAMLAVTVLAAASAASIQPREIVLDNGLRIFVVEKPTSPTFAALYQFGVGGAMDPKGRSGIAHLLEHMMFKGTRSLGVIDAEREAALMKRQSELWHQLHLELDRAAEPFGKPDQARIEALRAELKTLDQQHRELVIQNEYNELITRAGAVGINASTSNDWTNYYYQLPANRLEFWFQVESERLLDPVFREFYAERDVVQEERRLRSENSPSGQVYEAQRSLIFQAHPYGTPVIGWPGDLQRLTVEDAMSYFRTYYSPSNCTMFLVGDVSAQRVEELARKYFGRWQRQAIPRLQVTEEPEPTGERRRVIEFDAEEQVSVAWRTVPEGHPDQYPLEILGRILGGLASSRLDKTAVQSERIASVVGAYQTSQRYAGVFTVSGTPTEGNNSQTLEQAFERELTRIQQDGVTAEELERAKIVTESSRAGVVKNNLGLAFLLSSAVRASGSISYFEEYPQRIEAVTAEQVKQVATQYLTPKRRTVVTVAKTPGGIKPSRGGEAHQHGGKQGPRGQTHSSGFERLLASVQSTGPLNFRVPQLGKEIERVVLPSGVVVYIKEDHSAPVIDISFQWVGGSNSLPVEKLPPFELGSDLLSEGGTATLSPEAFQERKEQLGMTMYLYMGSTGSGGSLRSLKRTFESSWKLAMEAIQQPRLDADRLQTIRGQYIDGQRRRYESPGGGAAAIQQEVIWGDHPRFGYTISRSQIEQVTPEAIRAMWERYAGRDNLYIAAVGDFDKQQVLKLIDQAFRPWRKAKDKKRLDLKWEPRWRPGIYNVEKALPQPAVRISQPLAIDRTAPEADHAAIEVLNDIFGGSGFRSRLMERLRTVEGLTYGVSSFMSHQGRAGQPGSLGVSYQTKQASVSRSVELVLQEMRKLIEEEVTEAEVAEQVEAWRSRFVFGFTNDFSVVNRMLSSELDERPYDYLQRELAAVQKVTKQDVRRVAQQYFRPDQVTVSIYGALTEDDRKKFSESSTYKLLTREQVFKGGFDQPSTSSAPSGALRIE